MSKKEKCQLTGKEYSVEEMVNAESIPDSLESFIQSKFPEWNKKGYISNEELMRIRVEYIRSLLNESKGGVNKLDEQVLESIRKAETISKNIDGEGSDALTLGQRLADKVAAFGGSWNFIITFMGMLTVWIIINSIMLLQPVFDPYPFILLNLILSCIAALQAPVIMMSQNRQETKDRIRSQNDYQINLKAELEIRLLHEKIDHLLIQQGQKMFEIQEIQVELLQEILQKMRDARNI